MTSMILLLAMMIFAPVIALMSWVRPRRRDDDED